MLNVNVKTNPSSVKILPVLAPENTGAEFGPLNYSAENIKANNLNKSLEPEVWQNFMDSEPGSPEETKAARDLSEIFLGATAIQIMTTAKSADTLRRQADWLTQQSIEIYGEQNPEDTNSVLQQDLEKLSSLVDRKDIDHNELQSLLSFYEQFGLTTQLASAEQQSSLETADVAFKEYLEENYGFVLSHFEADKLYDAQELITTATRVIEELQEKDSRWTGWSVVTKQDGSMAVETRDKQIKIGVKRASSLGSEAGPALVHEFVDHALRSINGEEHADEKLQYGLGDYITFEEGLGCYMEYVLTGKVPAKIANRQIAASLALGQLGEGKHYDRNEIFEILKLRTKLLMQVEGEVIPEVLEAKTKELRTLIIDRFFRGGKGVAPAMSVYTKDIVYAQGFSLAQKYVSDQIAAGVDSEELFFYLLSAKFDPTNFTHRKYLEDVGIRTPRKSVQ